MLVCGRSPCLSARLGQLIAIFIATTAIGTSSRAQETSADTGTEFWTQVQGAVSVLDTRTDTPVQRLNVGAQFGARPERFGLFLNVEMNRSVDFGRVSPDVDFIQVGPGLDYFWKERRLRSSISAGPTFLTRDSGGEPAGKRGWFVDVRPISVRYALESGAVFELTPLAVDISKTQDEFTMYGNFVIVAYEWTSR